MSEETFKCADCDEVQDIDDQSHGKDNGDVVCRNCVDEAMNYRSTINVFEDGTVTIIYVSEYETINEYGDPFDTLTISRKYIQTDGWRGYHETNIEGWVTITDGWTTGGWGDPTADRKQVFNEWVEDMTRSDIIPPVPVAIVYDPTSNVFSMAITVLVKADDENNFREWLGEDINQLQKSLS